MQEKLEKTVVWIKKIPLDNIMIIWENISLNVNESLHCMRVLIWLSAKVNLKELFWKYFFMAYISNTSITENVNFWNYFVISTQKIIFIGMSCFFFHNFVLLGSTIVFSCVSPSFSSLLSSFLSWFMWAYNSWILDGPLCNYQPPMGSV